MLAAYYTVAKPTWFSVVLLALLAVDMNDLVLAIDPGARNIGMAFRIAGIYTTNKGEVPSDLYDFWSGRRPDVVIVETFAADAINTYGLQTVEMVGGVKALCYTYGVPVVQHHPQYRRAFLDIADNVLREILKRDNRKGIDNHERDALAHLLAWEKLQENK